MCSRHRRNEVKHDQISQIQPQCVSWVCSQLNLKLTAALKTLTWKPTSGPDTHTHTQAFVHQLYKQFLISSSTIFVLSRIIKSSMLHSLIFKSCPECLEKNSSALKPLASVSLLLMASLHLRWYIHVAATHPSAESKCSSWLGDWNLAQTVCF